MIFFIILIEWISVSIAVYTRMFQSAFSPIRDMKGDDTVNIVSTPYFPASPLPTSEPSTDSKVSRRLFENSSDDWTTDSSSNDWTTDSEAETEAEEPEIEFRWSATP